MKKRKYDSFGDFILNDKKEVMPFLLKFSSWSGVIILILASLITYLRGLYPLTVIFGLLGIFGIRKLFRHYKCGGFKMYKGHSANEMIWKKGDKK